MIKIEELTEWFSRKRQPDRFLLISGPCVIESENSCLNHALQLKRIAEKFDLPTVFKASFDKANRSSVSSFRGPGLQKGLGILARVKQETGLPVITDVHETFQVEPVAAVVDIIQIPALLCRQTDLLLACGKSGLPVNVKKGQFMAPLDMKNVFQKIGSTGNNMISVTERGTCFGYNNLVSDMRSIPLLRDLGHPVVFDATHSVQLPGAAGDCSSGERRFCRTLALSAVAAGCDGLFLEVHEDPEQALCDGPNMVDFRELEYITETSLKIRRALL